LYRGPEERAHHTRLNRSGGAHIGTVDNAGTSRVRPSLARRQLTAEEQ